MNPKLMRQYSDILNEYQTGNIGKPGNVTKPGTVPGTGMAGNTPKTGTGASGFPVAGTGMAGNTKAKPSGQAAKPKAQPATAPAVQATAAQTQTSNYAGGDQRTANARDANAAPPAGTPAPSDTGTGGMDPAAMAQQATAMRPSADAAPAAPAAPPVAADIAAGQNIGGKFAAAASQKAAQDSFAKLSGMAPTIQAQPTAPAQASPATPPGLAAATTPAPADNGLAQNPAIVSPEVGKAQASSQAAAPEQPKGVFSSPTPAAAMPASQAPTVTSGSGAPITTGSGGTLKSRSPDEIAKSRSSAAGSFMGGQQFEEDLDEEVAEESIDDQIEEAFIDMLRLSGILLNEKAVSKQQQKFMGMVHAMQKGEKVKGASKELKKTAKDMPKKAAKDYASTKHKGLPQKVSESVMLEAGNNLEHIVTRFKHETKRFLNGDELDDDLYNALYDYYVDNGEMPYGVAKAREGDPFQWVGNRFEDELATMGYERQFQETVMPVMDDTLSELARLAGLGLSESRVDECGDMSMDQRDSMNISTNMSSDGNKTVTISAQGSDAEALMQMLKLAGMGHLGHDSHTEEPVIMVSKDDDEMMEYANDPNEEYHSVDSIIHQGNDLNREKRQYADKPKLGDNPMAEDVRVVGLDEELEALLDSLLIKDDLDEGSIEKSGPNDLTGTWSSKKGHPDVDPPVPMDPVYPNAKDINKPESPKAPKGPSSPAIPRPGGKK